MHGSGQVGEPAVSPHPSVATGLSTAEVAERTAAGMVNDVPVRSSRSVMEIVRANLFTRINAIVGVLFAVILVVGPIQDALFGGVIIANTLIGMAQELRAKRTLDRLTLLSAVRPTVRRDGRSDEITAAEIVIDDVVEVGAGDRIVVDGTVVESDGLEIDESLLTGETDPLLKMPGDPVLSASFVVAGSGAMVTTRVGREAYAARQAEEARKFTLVDSELRNGINRILRLVTWAIIPTAAALVASQLMVNRGDLPEAVRRMVAGLVPMVPEGLVLLTSVAFAVGVIRLGRRQCLVQELPAIEGLARVDVVCLDKTGTLTTAAMTLRDVELLSGATTAAEADAALGALADTEERPNASLRAIGQSRPTPPDWQPRAVAPFSSARKWSGATFAVQPSGATVTWVLGAPDVLLRPADPVLSRVDELARRGLRVLLLARRATPLDDHPGEAGPVDPVALVLLGQQLREEAPRILRYFAAQGVSTKIVSGDNAVAVGAVATALGLPGADRPVDARHVPDEELSRVTESAAVFGRVSPVRKREIVAALQAQGHTVAMTGDGVNDVPALKHADIGICMGSGSPATRGVAQLVLLNNDFSVLPAVVAEGRRVIGNIERVANLFLTKTVYSVLLAVVVALVQVPYPFLPRHLTLIGTLTIGLPSFMLALAPTADRARPGFIARVLRFALPAGVLGAVTTMTSYLIARAHYRGDLAAETSCATLALFVFGLWVLAIISRPYTRWRVLLVLAMAAAFGLTLVVPFLQQFFALRLVGTAAPLAALAVSVGAGLLLEGIWARLSRGR
ncbi:HAD-IC family P-type ATPase [Mangrovihabitans endophyticus]|uniref:Magnesium-transporting ATPase n=1 Tax=Mangrovihabitans endophyticus TaxID=1751298 RepID=A0A8J3FMG7_9ACTN|nr:HAD-IC family P-type ATPase [Mangrovihabitans endophyticus]GGK73211.1 magnesium-transporting ATPase [Mangrovihabitans endophyticus]